MVWSRFKPETGFFREIGIVFLSLFRTAEATICRERTEKRDYPGLPDVGTLFLLNSNDPRPDSRPKHSPENEADQQRQGKKLGIVPESTRGLDLCFDRYRNPDRDRVRRTFGVYVNFLCDGVNFQPCDDSVLFYGNGVPEMIYAKNRVNFDFRGMYGNGFEYGVPVNDSAFDLGLF